jgi:hypothetical protein
MLIVERREERNRTRTTATMLCVVFGFTALLFAGLSHLLPKKNIPPLPDALFRNYIQIAAGILVIIAIGVAQISFKKAHGSLRDPKLKLPVLLVSLAMLEAAVILALVTLGMKADYLGMWIITGCAILMNFAVILPAVLGYINAFEAQEKSKITN